MTDTPTIEQRAKGYADKLRQRLASPLTAPQVHQAFITAITEAERIGEARGMERAYVAFLKHTEPLISTTDAIRKEAAERAGGGAHE